MPIHKSDIVENFNKVADLLEINDANPFRVRAYRNAARIIGGLSKSVVDLIDEGKPLTDFSVIGKDLAEMDGYSSQESVVVMAATNRPDVLNSALVRPGRFDRRITLDIPQREARQKILETHTRKVPLAKDVDLADLAERTVGLSGAWQTPN